NPARTAVDLDIRDAAAGIFPAHHIVVATLAHAQHPTGTARLDSAGHGAGVSARAAVATRRIAQSLARIAAGLLPAILIAIPVAAARLSRRVRQRDEGDQAGQKKGSNTHHGSRFKPGPLNSG